MALAASVAVSFRIMLGPRQFRHRACWCSHPHDSLNPSKRLLCPKLLALRVMRVDGERIVNGIIAGVRSVLAATASPGTSTISHH